MRKQVQEMEDEARKLQEMQESIQGDSSNKEEVDQRSVFVGNVRFCDLSDVLQNFSLPSSFFVVCCSARCMFMRRDPRQNFRF